MRHDLPHDLPLRDAESPEEPEKPRMTIRIYTVNRDGTVLHDRGTIDVTPGPYAPDFLTLTSAFPPCGCARCAVDRPN